MRTPHWDQIGIYGTMLTLAGRAPFKLAILGTLPGITGSVTVLNRPPWNHPQWLGMAMYLLLVFTLACARPRNFREVAIAVVVASLCLFPLTFAFLTAGLLVAGISIIPIFAVSRLWMAYLYYRPANPDHETPPTDDLARSGANEDRG